MDNDSQAQQEKVKGQINKWKEHSPSQVIPIAFISLVLIELPVIHSEIFDALGLQLTILGRKSPEPWLNFSGLVGFLFFPQPTSLQTISELVSVHPSSTTLCHRPLCWISTLPAHSPGPSFNLTFTLSVS